MKEKSQNRIVQAISSPWVLLTIPTLLGGMWLILHPQIITENLNKPYALAIIPVGVVSIIIGWLIITFFKTIEAWCKRAYQAALKANKDNNSARFFGFVILVFMVVSVLEAGPFFNVLEHGALYGLLGYITVFAIDLIAIQSMFARLEAVRMRDEVGARIYLMGVLICAGLSAFANGYSSLSGFQEQVTGDLPAWMNSVAPWLGIGFPLLILLLSITADYTVDRTSSKLDADKYRLQEQKRIAVLKVRYETQKEALTIEHDLAKVVRERKALQRGKKERTFILIRWLFPRDPLNMQDVVESVIKTINPQIQALIEQNKVLHNQLNSLANQGQQIQALQRQDRAIIDHQIEAIRTQRDVDMEALMSHVKGSIEALSQRFNETIENSVFDEIEALKDMLQQDSDTAEMEAMSKGNQDRYNRLDDKAKEVLSHYPIVLRRLSTGPQSMTIQDIIDDTGHTYQMVHKHARSGAFRETKRKGYYRISSVIEWLKTVSLPKSNEGNSRPITDEIAPALPDDYQEDNDGYNDHNGHSKDTVLLDNLAELVMQEGL